MPGTMSIGGLMSGLKTDDIISKVMQYARRPQARLQEQKADYQVKLAAWQDVNVRVLALKGKSESIADMVDFQGMAATSSDSDVVTASASTSAAEGTYHLRVISRAQAHQVSSQAGAYASVNDIVGTGTVHFELQSGEAFNVHLTSANNTLAGLRDAINKADEGVQATIVNAGTSTATDYRLLLTSTQSGIDSQMTVVETTGLTGGTAPTFDLGNPVQAAASATIELGEGLGKITVTKDTNTVTDLIPGVTLNLLSAAPSTTVRIDLTPNTDDVRTAIESFVNQYNDLSDAIEAQFQYDSDTGETPPLFGDYQLQNVQSDIVSMLTTPVGGLTSNLNALASIGITQDIGGHLVISSTSLQTALEDDMSSVSRIFGAGIDSESSYVSFLASTADTEASGRAGWQIDITQAASRAQVTAGTAMSGALTANEVLTVNGKAISLTVGMTIDDVITRVNAYTSDTNVVAMKTDEFGTGAGNFITFRHVQYGDAYNVTVISNLSRSLGSNTGVGNVAVTGTAPQGEDGLGYGMAGLDVAGTINGQVATGNGQILRFSSSNSTNDANGISLLITASEALSTNIVYTKGVGAGLRELLSGMTSTTGAITQAQNSVNSAISQSDTDIADMESRLQAQEDRLYAQFNAMEAQLARLTQQGNYLSAQLSAMNKSK